MEYAGVKLPQLPCGLHVQFTPYDGFPSLLTVALIVAIEPAARVIGSDEIMAIVMGAVTVIAAVDDADSLDSVVDIAVIVTVPPLGIAEGALYRAGTPLAVCDVMEPQLPGLLQFNVQSAPWARASLETVAVKLAVLDVCTL